MKVMGRSYDPDHNNIITTDYCYYVCHVICAGR